MFKAKSANILLFNRLARQRGRGFYIVDLLVWKWQIYTTHLLSLLLISCPQPQFLIVSPLISSSYFLSTALVSDCVTSDIFFLLSVHSPSFWLCHLCPLLLTSCPQRQFLIVSSLPFPLPACPHPWFLTVSTLPPPFYFLSTALVSVCDPSALSFLLHVHSPGFWLCQLCPLLLTSCPQPQFLIVSPLPFPLPACPQPWFLTVSTLSPPSYFLSTALVSDCVTSALPSYFLSTATVSGCVTSALPSSCLSTALVSDCVNSVPSFLLPIHRHSFWLCHLWSLLLTSCPQPHFLIVSPLISSSYILSTATVSDCVTSDLFFLLPVHSPSFWLCHLWYLLLTSCPQP